MSDESVRPQDQGDPQAFEDWMRPFDQDAEELLGDDQKERNEGEEDRREKGIYKDRQVKNNIGKDNQSYIAKDRE